MLRMPLQKLLSFIVSCMLLLYRKFRYSNSVIMDWSMALIAFLFKTFWRLIICECVRFLSCWESSLLSFKPD